MTLTAQGVSLAGRLADVTLTLQPGEITAICGPNGAGKSSLLAVLAGLLKPESGEIALDAAPLKRLPAQARAQAIGYLAQSPDVAWDVSVETLVTLGRLPWPGSPGGDAIERAIASMDLAALRHRPLSQLSGGEKARALLARALAGEPRWLLADEPLANLDLAHALALMRCLREAASGGKGVAVVLHDLAMAMNHADRVVVLQWGRVVVEGQPVDALDKGTLARVWNVDARWLGKPGARALTLSRST